MKFSIVEIIQAMLAPGLMISACGLFLLGMNNKYSLLVNRIRLLNEEKRKLDPGEKRQNQEKRRKSIIVQIKKLNFRLKLVRNAVFSYSAGVACFIIASLLIGFKYLTQSGNAASVAMVFFLLGIVSVFIGISFAAMEVYKGFKIVEIEISEKQNPPLAE
jgi:hypothetical protein